MLIVRDEDVSETKWWAVWRVVVAALLGVHGLIHLLGFLAVWGMVELAGVNSPPSLYLTNRPISDPLVRGFALGWLVAGVLFVFAAAGTVSRQKWWRVMAPIAAAISLVPTFLWWMDAGWGFFVSLAILLSACCSNRATIPLTPEELGDRDLGKELTRTGA